MKLKRLLSCMLAMVLVLSLLPVGVLAEPLTTTVATYEEIPFQINPLYEGLVSPESFASAETAPEEEGGLSHTQPTFNSPKATYVSPDEAAIILREQLKARSTSIDLYIVSDIEDYQLMLDVILGVAMVHTGEPTEGDYLLWQFGGWGGGVDRQFENGYYYDHYVLDVMYYSTAEQEAELDAAIDQVLTSLNLEGKSDYEKVCAIYDYICTHVTYDYEHLNDYTYLPQYTAYAALINGTAVCQGYANLLYRMLLEVGIDNRIITGEVEEGPHAWNIVKLGDVYYNVDATWDSIIGDHTYFLRNSEGFLDHYRYLEYCTSMFHLVYPMSETDYVDGVAGVPEHIYVRGVCGEDAYWTIDWDGVLTIYGTGAMADHPANELALWDYWEGDFDTIVIEEGITVIGQRAFGGLQNVVKVSLPDSLTLIGYCSFYNCDALTEINIPDGVTRIASSAFSECDNLETVTLGNSVDYIDSEAFYNCVALKEITIPKSTRYIDENAFGNCVLLKELTVPENVIILDGFQGCTGLETADVHSFRVEAFRNCTSLKNVTLHETVELLANQAFYGCTALEEITIPASVYEIRAECFSNCTNLKEVTFLGDAPIFDKNVFQNVTATVYYPADNATWTEEVMQQYGGNITWLPDTEKVPEVPEGLLGDVSSDGIVDSYDAALVAMYDVSLIGADGLDLAVADVSGDDIVDSYDAALIAMYDVALIPGFPAAS